MARVRYSDELYHYGIKGQKWGVRRFQDEIGRLTPEGRRRYREHANDVHKTNSEAMLISRKANIRRMEVEEAEKLYKKKEQLHKTENSSDSKKQLDSAKKVLDEAVKSYNDANKEAVDHYNNIVQFYGQNHRIQKIKRNKRGMFNDRRAERVSLTNKQKASAIGAGIAAAALGYAVSKKIPDKVMVNMGTEKTNIPGTDLNVETPKRTNISKGLKIATTVGIGAAAAAGAYGASKYASSRRNDPSKSQWATYYYPGKKRAQKRFAKGLVRSKYETKYGRKTASDRKHMKEDYTEFKI